MSLNPASQPFVPSNTFTRRDSAVRFGVGDDDEPIAHISAALSIAGDRSGVKATPVDRYSTPDPDDGMFGALGGTRTPGGTGNSTGNDTVVAGGGGGGFTDHSRFSSSFSSGASFQSAHSSPQTPPDGQMARQTSQDGSSTHGIHSRGDISQQPLVDSPPGILTSLPRSDSQLTEHGDTMGIARTEFDGGLAPLLSKGPSDRSFPALEAHFRKIPGERDALTSSPANTGPESVGSVGSTNSGFLSNHTPFKLDEISSLGLDPASSNAGLPPPQRQGLQLSPSPFSRLGSRFSTYASVGNQQRPHTPVNDLAPPGGHTQQLYQTQAQPQTNPIARSMSLSLINANGHQTAGLPVRKSSYAFEQTYSPQQQPSRSPLPSTFQNYTLGNANHHSSSTNTPTDGAFRLPANNFPGSALAPHVTHVGGDNTSSSPSSSVRSSAGHVYEAAETFDAQAKASPFINDLLDRVIRCEYSTREVQRELGDLNHKVSLLLGRTINHGAPSSSSTLRGPTYTTEPNRGDASTSPFAGNTITPTGGTPGTNAGVANNFYNFPNGSSSSSLVSPSPNITKERDEEINQLTQRVATLTASVAQLLAVQSQAQIQSMNAGFAAPSPGGMGSRFNNNNGTPSLMVGGGGTPNVGLGMGLGTPNMSGTPDLNQLGGVMGGPRGVDLGMRSSPRAPIPVRTWSQGSVDMMALGGAAGRQDGMGLPPMMRDKRRSIAPVGRRDSAGGDPNGDWNGGGSSRDANGGPVITKWEHLPLAPELLRSIAKYGVGPPNKIQQRALPFLLRGADIIAQAPPTQERIAAYAIPAIHVALSVLAAKPTSNRGPFVLIISTTVDQATQAQRMIRDMGNPIGIRSALGVGTGGDVVQELRLLQQNMPHVLCGTPQKLHSLFTAPNGLPGSEVRFLVLDEVDQLIARNLHEFVFNIVKVLPPPRSRPLSHMIQSPTGGSLTPIASPAVGNPSTFSPFEVNSPTVGSSAFSGPVRRFSSTLMSSPNPDQTSASTGPVERQTALFSNTVPQDVLNLATTIQLREPVRVLVRRDGNVAQSDTNTTSRGLRQYYLYLAFTAAGAATRTDARATTPSGTGGGLGIIGSGRSAGSTLSNAETVQAREWKLDALADLFDDIDVGQVIVHVGGMSALDAVVYKLASRGLETVPLHGDMTAATRAAALNKFRGGGSAIRTTASRVLVVYEVQVKAPEVFQIPLIINYDLPKAVEEYAHRVAPAISNNYSRSGVIINFVTATGGDVEMLRSIECFYKIKCPEVPMSLRDVL